MENSKKKKIAIIVGTVVILAVILGLYLGLPVEKKYHNEIFGNLYMQTIIKTNITNQSNVGNKLYDQVTMIDKLTNPTKESSDIYRINHSKVDEKISVSPVTIDLLEISKDVFDKTNGLYNPASYYLVDIWGFSAEKFQPNIDHTEPSQENIDLGIKLANTFKDIKFIEKDDTDAQIAEKEANASFIVNKKEHYVIRTNRAQVGDTLASIDLGGIAKGYAAELCYKVFKNTGAENGLVNIAGNVYTFNKDWSIGIENPFKDKKYDDGTEEPGIFGAVVLNNLSVSCSGVYLRNYTIKETIDGEEVEKFYHHIIDTKTGRPMALSNDSIIMASVIGKDGAICDSIATSLILMGSIENAEAFLNNNYKDEIKAVILITANKEYKIIGNIPFTFNEKELKGFTKIEA